MGIRNLTTTLRPYGEPCVLDANSRVVIDGPALAYHIIGLCSPKHGPTSPFAQPSYELLASAAIAWLEELERQGPRVAAVYFDGRLPRHKVPERLERSLWVSRQLNNFFLATPHGVAEAKPRAGPIDPKQLFSRSARPSPGATGTLPVPPLAVQAICDALRQSDRYGDLTQLVPEEADCYCADWVRTRGGGVVLTSDSDLLVFDLGEEGGVVFLKDVELGGDAKSEGLRVQLYSPAKISKRLALPENYGLSSLAFELHLDSHLGGGKLLERARQATAIKESPGAYLSFMEQYRLFPLEESSAGASVTPAELCAMDSRLAELTIQCLKLHSSGSETSTSPAGPEADGQDNSLLIFLPPLVDAWTRTSAWEIASPIRELSYCILRLGLPTAEVEVREYRRLTTAASSGTRVSLPAVDSSGSVEKSCVELTALIRKIREHLSRNLEDETSDLTWTVLSMHQDIKQSQQSGKQSLVLHMLRLATDSDGAFRDCGTWDVLHLVAQLQATLYSLRMLKQALGFATQRAQRKSAEGQSNPLPAALDDLSAVLSYHLPPITAYCSVHEVGDLPRRLKEAGGLDLLKELAGLEEPITFGAGSDRQSKKKRKRAAQTGHEKGADSKSRSQPATAKNRFSLLNALGTE